MTLMLAGCASSGGADPPTTPPADRAGAPTISTPRDLTSRGTASCSSLLTLEQLQRLGLDRTGESSVDAQGSPTCRWVASGSGGRSVTAAVVLDEDLFVGTYRRRETPIFRAYEIGGLPAVDTQFSANSPACTTTIGVADGQTLDVTGSRGTRSGERDVDACAISRRAAEEIVSTLPPL